MILESTLDGSARVRDDHVTTTRKLTFTTRSFVRSHGSAPRGRGCWAFQASTSADAYDHHLRGDIMFVPDATLTEAKAEIAARVGSGVWCVAVLP